MCAQISTNEGCVPAGDSCVCVKPLGAETLHKLPALSHFFPLFFFPKWTYTGRAIEKWQITDNSFSRPVISPIHEMMRVFVLLKENSARSRKTEGPWKWQQAAGRSPRTHLARRSAMIMAARRGNSLGGWSHFNLRVMDLCNLVRRVGGARPRSSRRDETPHGSSLSGGKEEKKQIKQGARHSH